MLKNRTPLDEFAKLLENPSHDLSVDVYNGNKKIQEKGVKKRKSKYTLNEIGDALFELINRFDYVVKTNNLKDLSKQKRMKK
ncbi:MAG: hypothetical protein MJ214_01135 [Bacilli bacterium]|nr:hypothetical protein [Bacilli bacterium]